MRAEQLALGDSAFKAYGTFLDERHADLLRRSCMKSADREFVNIPAAPHAAEVDRFHHSGGGEIYDEFAGIADSIVREALRTHRYVCHRRTCADDAGPADSQDVGLFGSAAGNECGRDGSEQSAALPELFRHRRVPFVRVFKCIITQFCDNINRRRKILLLLKNGPCIISFNLEVCHNRDAKLPHRKSNTAKPEAATRHFVKYIFHFSFLSQPRRETSAPEKQ